MAAHDAAFFLSRASQCDFHSRNCAASRQGPAYQPSHSPSPVWLKALGMFLQFAFMLECLR